MRSKGALDEAAISDSGEFFTIIIVVARNRKVAGLHIRVVNAGYRALVNEKIRTRSWRRDDFGGAGENRTPDKGFADLRLTTWLPRHKQSDKWKRTQS